MNCCARKSARWITAEEAAKHPLRRSIDTPGTLGYLAAYVMIAGGTVTLAGALVVSGSIMEIATQVVPISCGIFFLQILRRREKEELAKNGSAERKR